MPSRLSAFLVATLLLWLTGTTLVTGATITASNFDGSDSNLLTDANGQLLNSGSVRLGTFSFSDANLRQAFQQRTPQELASSFSQFGRSVAVYFDGLPGLYQSTIQDSITDHEHPLHGETIYTIVTDTPSLEAAAEWLVFRHEQVFLEDPLPHPPALLNAKTSGELLVGEFGKHTASVGQIVDRPAYSLATVPMIPEPSTSISLLLSTLLLTLPRQRR